jgi:hypothetical protein
MVKPIVSRDLPAHSISLAALEFGKIAPISGNVGLGEIEFHSEALSAWDFNPAFHGVSMMQFHAKALSILYLVKYFYIGDHMIYQAMVSECGKHLLNEDIRGWIGGYLCYERNLVLSCNRYELSK